MTIIQAMKSRPMLFSAPMVRALLDGSKTQTRREFKAKNGGLWPNKNGLPGAKQILRNCPYGQIGDQLWAKETWRVTRGADRLPPRGIAPSCSVWYEADLDHDADNVFIGKRRPSIFMPRWASRITLEIVSVRVERLQDISESDAKAEGAIPSDGYAGPQEDRRKGWVDAYKKIWADINGPESWAANPWVWVVEFKRAKP